MDAAMKPPWMCLRPEGSTLGVRRPQQGYSDSIVRGARKPVTWKIILKIRNLLEIAETSNLSLNKTI